MQADNNGIMYMEGTDVGGNFISLFNAAMSSVSAGFSVRQRRNYVWPTEDGLIAQRGMTEGSTAYQLDKKIEYKFENGKWRLAVPHIEYNVSRTLGDSASFGGIVDGAASVSQNFTSSSSFVQDLGDGHFRIIDPGIYSFSMVSRIVGLSSVGITELVVARSENKVYGGILGTGGIFDGRSYGSVAIPNVRLVTANNEFGFAISKRTGGDAEVTSTIRITRIG